MTSSKHVSDCASGGSGSSRVAGTLWQIFMGSPSGHKTALLWSHYIVEISDSTQENIRVGMYPLQDKSQEHLWGYQQY